MRTGGSGALSVVSADAPPSIRSAVRSSGCSSSQIDSDRRGYTRSGPTLSSDGTIGATVAYPPQRTPQSARLPSEITKKEHKEIFP